MFQSWHLNRASYVDTTDLDGNLDSQIRSYYDGAAYEGLPLGQVTLDDLTRKETNLGPLNGDRWVPVERQAFDEWGNVIGIKDADDKLTTVGYDPLVHAFPCQNACSLSHPGTGDGRRVSHGLNKVGAAWISAASLRQFYDPFGHVTNRQDG